MSKTKKTSDANKIKVTDGGRSVRLTEAEFDFLRHWTISMTYDTYVDPRVARIADKFCRPEVTKERAKKTKEESKRQLERILAQCSCGSNEPENPKTLWVPADKFQ